MGIMPLSYASYTGNGATTDYAVTFPYLSTADVFVSVNGAAVGFSWVNSTLVRCDVAPANGATVKVYRSTPLSTPAAEFQGGSTLTSDDLNLAVRQAYYAAQETADAVADQGTLAGAGTGTGLPNCTAANDFLVGNGVGGTYVRKSLAQTQAILGVTALPAGANRVIGTDGSGVYTAYTPAAMWTKLGGTGAITDIVYVGSLGTAASKNTGTADGNVPLLSTVSAKVSLPAVSGQQLTDIMRGVQQARFEMRTAANIQPYSYNQLATNAAYNVFNKRALTDQIVNNIAGCSYTQLTSPGAHDHNGANQGEIVLPAGTYLFEVEAALATGLDMSATDYLGSFLRLYDVTNATEKYRGVTVNRQANNLCVRGVDRLSCIVSTSGATFRVDHWIGCFKIADDTTGGSPTIRPGHTPGTAPTPNVHTVINITKLLIQ